jgi:hypothetical protein
MDQMEGSAFAVVVNEMRRPLSGDTFSASRRVTLSRVGLFLSERPNRHLRAHSAVLCPLRDR